MRIQKSVKMGELRSLAAFAVEKIDGARISDTLLSGFSKKVAELAARLEDAMNAERAGMSLAKEDRERDSALKALVYYTKGLSYSVDEDEANAAKALAAIIARHNKNLARKNFEDETGIIDALLKDLKSDEAAPSVEKAGCAGALIDILSAANEAFKSEKIKRNLEIQAQKSKESAYVIRETLFSEFNMGLMRYLEAAVKGDKATYGAVFDSINAEISTINAKIALRKKSETAQQA